jgi:GMP synthase-like glutamine amidotransferase
MRVRVFQHHPAEGPARVAVWADSRGHDLSTTRLYDDPPLPAVDAVDFLVVLGGPMNVYEEALYPWLAGEKDLLRATIAAGRPILGICLGAQLLADVLGGKVTRNREREVGWFEVAATPEAKRSPIFGGLPLRYTALHWHGDTFSIPPGALHAARSEACANQAFEVDGRFVGLQFHLEATTESVSDLIAAGAGDLAPGPFVQTAEEIRRPDPRMAASNRLMEAVLDAMARISRR